jgi:hypothetical protein
MRAVARIASVLLCCTAVAPAIAEAKVKPTSTQIAVGEAGVESIRLELSSPSKKCLRERTLTFVDVDTGSIFFQPSVRDGSFSVALIDLPPAVTRFRATVEPATIANRLCESDSVTAVFDFATLSGGPKDGTFGGVLFSSVEACEPNRLISLYEVSSDPVFVGSDFADASGAWTIAQAAGRFEARADLTIIRDEDSVTYCQPVVSAAWTFEEPPEEAAALEARGLSEPS